MNLWRNVVNRGLLPLALVLTVAGTAAAQEAPFPQRDEKLARWGFIDRGGKVVIPHQFAQVTRFREGLAAVCRELTPVLVDEDGTERTVHLATDWEYIDTTGKTVISNKRGSWRFSGGLAVTGERPRGPFGYMDREGKQVVPERFERADDFEEGRAIVRIDGRAGAIDRTGKLVVPATWKGLGPYAGGRASFWDGEKTGYIDLAGKVVVPARYEPGETFSEGLAFVKMKDARTGKSTGGYIDRRGKLVIRRVEGLGGPFREERARILGDKTAHWIDRKGKKVRAPEAEWVGDFSEGLAAIKIGGKVGYADRAGKIVIPPRWDFGEVFAGGLAIVADLDTKSSYVVNFRYIDRAGNVIAPLSASESPPR